MSVTKLLSESINHHIVNYHEIDHKKVKLGSFHCPLCVEFLDSGDEDKPCLGCPVNNVTGEGCETTPYYGMVWAFNNWVEEKTPESYRAYQTVTQFEIDFLRDLFYAPENKGLFNGSL